MGVLSSELVFYEASLRSAEDDTTSTVGGSLTAFQIDGIIDELYETVTANEVGGGNKTRYAKFFISNETVSGSSLLGLGSSVGVWMRLILNEGATPDNEVPFTVKIKGRTL